MQQNNSKQSNQSEIEFNFVEIVRILLNSKLLIVLTTIAVGAIGWMYSIYFNPTLPPSFAAASVIEIGSYKASDEELSQARDGRILIASMDATEARLNALYGIHRPADYEHWRYITKYDGLIQRISIYEIDSQFLKIEVVGATLDIVKNKTNEMIEYIKSLHDGLLDDVIEKKKREIKNIEEKLLTIDKFINYISEQNDMYIYNVSELKLKELEYKHELAELYRFFNKNLDSAKESIGTQINFDLIPISPDDKEHYTKTDTVGEIEFKINYPKSNLIKLVLSSFIIGFILSSIFVVIRHALANNYKK